jgi:hypothetical protein
MMLPKLQSSTEPLALDSTLPILAMQPTQLKAAGATTAYCLLHYGTLHAPPNKEWEPHQEPTEVTAVWNQSQPVNSLNIAASSKIAATPCLSYERRLPKNIQTGMQANMLISTA